MSCGVGRRLSLDLALLWLWCRPAATALIQPLAWEPPYAMGMVQAEFINKVFFGFLLLLLLLLFVVVSFLAALWHVQFPGQGSDPSCSCDLS